MNLLHVRLHRTLIPKPPLAHPALKLLDLLVHRPHMLSQVAGAPEGRRAARAPMQPLLLVHHPDVRGNISRPLEALVTRRTPMRPVLLERRHLHGRRGDRLFGRAGGRGGGGRGGVGGGVVGGGGGAGAAGEGEGGEDDGGEGVGGGEVGVEGGGFGEEVGGGRMDGGQFEDVMSHRMLNSGGKKQRDADFWSGEGDGFSSGVTVVAGF
eukprot:CAMPEP_0184711866 /NCGR_PEP_ID=MMETSP0314-20130426/2492_1 /TAXON_ID=38298 /ORGANISM="Rhodella maculata, Strain CCMP 736" /LENGTH=208 /DNA_ID=CAMNT_0027174139 /DNA_START=431 /DNA_END=1054 /DNA_ORIENTATION=-